MLLFVFTEHLKLDSQFIYCTVTLYVFQFVICVCTVQSTSGVELLQRVSILFLWFLVDVEVLG
jgi:hypothetical protein